MKKIIKNKSSHAPRQDKQDTAVLIQKMHEQLVSLEKKIDTLLGQSRENLSEGKNFPKPFRRFERSQHHDRGKRGDDFRGRNFTKVICSDCNRECEVPFRPSGDRPVYCKDCFAKRKQGFTQERHFDKQDKQENSENRKQDKREPAGFRRRK